MTAPPQIRYNLSLWDFPAYLGGYKYCEVKMYVSAGGGRSTLTIDNEELALIRKLYVINNPVEDKLRNKSSAPREFIFPKNSPQLELMIFKLALSGLVQVKQKKVSLSQAAYIADYDLFPYESKV